MIPALLLHRDAIASPTPKAHHQSGGEVDELNEVKAESRVPRAERAESRQPRFENRESRVEREPTAGRMKADIQPADASRRNIALTLPAKLLSNYLNYIPRGRLDN